jgi:glyoxylase-like metal-dependent hydrolase (beta-lactamase superfamily II)
MRAIAVHEDVIVVISAVWQTTCTFVRSGDEGFLVDSPVLPDELDALPALVEQSRLPVNGLLATHGDFDHLLGKLAFPDLSLGVGETTAGRLTESIGEAQRRLRDFDAEWYLEGRAPLGLADFQPLPTPGRISIGSGTENELEVYPADGHTGDGVAFWIPWASVLVCGDYISPVEIPMISAAQGGSFSAYEETLLRFAPLVQRAATVIPGHGAPMSRERALEILAEDLSYVHAGSQGDEPELPDSRRTSAQKRNHERNLDAL